MGHKLYRKKSNYINMSVWSCDSDDIFRIPCNNIVRIDSRHHIKKENVFYFLCNKWFVSRLYYIMRLISS